MSHSFINYPSLGPDAGIIQDLTPAAMTGTPANAVMGSLKRLYNRAGLLGRAMAASQTVGFPPPIDGTVPTVTVESNVYNAPGNLGYSTITNPVAFLANNAVFRYIGCKVAQLTTGNSQQNQYFGTLPATYVTSNGYLPPLVVDFTTDAPAIELLTSPYGTGPQYRVRIDGVYVSSIFSSGLTNDGSPVAIKLAFGSRAQRVIQLEISGAANFGGVVVGVQDSVYASSRRIGPRLMFMGDSYTAGSGCEANGDYNCYGMVAGALLGCETICSGSSGTGYVTTNAPNPTLIGRFDNDIVPFNPDILVFAAGLNDNGQSSGSISAALNAIYTKALTELPNTQIICLSAFTPRQGINNAAISAVTSLIQSAAASFNFPFIDTTSYMTGTGFAGAANGTGNSDFYICTDSTHPLIAGHNYIGHRLAADLLRTGVVF